MRRASGVRRAASGGRPSRVTILPLLASGCFALGYGLNYAVVNQFGYMLAALRRLDPGLLANDWYVTKTTTYHPVFSWIAWFLLLFDRGGWGIGIGLFVVTTAGALCIYWLTRQIVADRVLALAAFLLLLSIQFITRTNSLAGSYIFDNELQPSTFGSVFLLAAIPPFVAGRYRLSGVLLGLGGLFHANYLVLGVATFGLAHLLLPRASGAPWWKDLLRRLVEQLAPSMVALLLLLPMFLRSAAPKDAAEGLNILFNVRSPHHYAPKGYERDFFPHLAWQVLGLGAGGWLLRGAGGRGARLGAVIAAMVMVVWGGTLLSTAIVIQKVVQLFVWRFSPFLELCCQLLACAATVRIAAEPTLHRRISRAALATFIGGAAALVMVHANHGDTRYAGALGFVLAPGLAGVLLSQGVSAVDRRRATSGGPSLAARLAARRSLVRWPVAVIGLVATGAYGWPRVWGFAKASNLVTPHRGPEHELYDWLRTHTPRTAVLLTPPGLEGFRLVAERAIVVDWKGCPIIPAEVVEWSHRLGDVSGRHGFHGPGDVSSGYAGMDLKRVTALREKYGPDYLVVAHSHDASLNALPVAYSNPQYVVFTLGSPPAPAPAPAP